MSPSHELADRRHTPPSSAKSAEQIRGDPPHFELHVYEHGGGICDSKENSGKHEPTGEHLEVASSRIAQNDDRKVGAGGGPGHGVLVVMIALADRNLGIEPCEVSVD